VSKSPLVIAALGVGACVALSLMMQQLTSFEADRGVAPYLAAVERKFADRLVGPLRLREELAAGQPRLVVQARLRDGLEPARLAEELGAEVWRHAVLAGSKAASLRIVVRPATERTAVAPPLAAVVLARPLPVR
jgi:hypothetical protein